MISIKSRNAFTFAEVLISLFVLAISMMILSNLQTKSIFRVLRGREQIERIFYIKQHLYNMFMAEPSDKTKPEKLRLDEPQLVLIKQRKEISKKSALKDFAKTVHIISSEGTWKSGQAEKTMELISFVLKKERKKDEKS